MARWSNTEAEDEDDGIDDREAPDPADQDDEDDDAAETEPCPYCGTEVYEGAERCPRCGKYLSGEDAPPRRKPRWFLIAAIVCLLIAMMWAIFGTR